MLPAASYVGTRLSRLGEAFLAVLVADVVSLDFGGIDPFSVGSNTALELGSTA